MVNINDNQWWTINAHPIWYKSGYDGMDYGKILYVHVVKDSN